MKKVFLKRINILLVVLLILFFSISGTVYSDSPLTNVVVTVYPASPSVNAQYTIAFDYNGTLSSATITIMGLNVSSAPVSGTIPGVTLNGSVVSATCNASSTIASITIGPAPVNSGQNTIVIPQSAGIFNPVSGTYQINLTVSGNQALSNPYTIGASQVSNVQVSVSPPLKGVNAGYQVSFKTSANGQLTANTNKIYIQFPLGTGLPASIDGSYIKVNNIPCIGTITVDTINRTVGIPLPLNIYSNADVTVTISDQAAITNPSSIGSYYLILWTTTDSEHVNSPVYSISSSSVSQLTVSPPVPSTVGAAAGYTIQFYTSSSGALVANADTISINFPASTYVPHSGLQASYISINNQSCSYVTATGTTVTVKTPVSIGDSSSVKVVISKSFGIKNPTQAGAYKVSVSTSKDLNPVDSPEYTISATTLSKAYVIVTPAIIGANAQYVIQFSTGSGGALSASDTIQIVFPQGTSVPNSVPISSINVNGALPSTVTSSSLSRSLTVTLPPNFSVIGGGRVALSISNSAGIKNPGAPGNYSLSVSTSKESTLVLSNPYKIYGAPTTQLTVTPASPDGKNGYYVTTPHIELKLDNPTGLPATIYYRIDQNPEHIYSGSFTVPDGTHTVYYYSKMSNGITEQKNLKQFRVDTTPPVLSVTAPQNNETVYKNTVLVNGTTEKGVSLTVNSQAASVANDGTFTATVIVNKEGVNTIDVVAVDAAGNKSEREINFIYIARAVVMLQVGNTKAYVNNELVPLDAAPFIYKGRVMVPLRFLSDSLHATIEWDGIFKIASLTIGNLRIRVQVGNTVADVGGKAVSLDSPPVIVKGRTFVPLRFVSENFGAAVNWDGKMKIVNIIYPKP